LSKAKYDFSTFKNRSLSANKAVLKHLRLFRPNFPMAKKTLMVNVSTDLQLNGLLDESIWLPDMSKPLAVSDP